MRRGLRWGLLLLSACWLAWLGGCGAGDAQMEALVQEWARTHAGEILSYKLTGSSGDRDTDAAFQIKQALDAIDEADAIMSRAQLSHDAQGMLKAVNKRPEDWHYRLLYGAELLVRGETTAAAEQFRVAEELVRGRSLYQPRYADRSISALEEANKRLQGKALSAGQCALLYERLSTAYRLRATLTDSPKDLELAERYEEQKTGCK